MTPVNDEPDGGLYDVQETGSDTEHNHVLESSTDDVPVAKPYSSSSDELLEPGQALQHRPKVFPEKEAGTMLMRNIGRVLREKVTIEVRVPPPERPWEYQRIPEENIVEAVIEEAEHPGSELWYKISFEDGREADVSDTCSL